MLLVATLGEAYPQWVPAGSLASRAARPTTTPERPEAQPPTAARSPESKLEAARQLEKQGEWEKARRIYLALVQESPELATPYHRLAVLSSRQNDLASAERYFSLATSADPLNATILNDWGYMLYLEGKLDESERLLRLAESLAPDDRRIQNNLGVVLGRMGRLEESFQAFRKAGTPAEAHANMAFVHARRGELDLAEDHYRQAISLDPTMKRISELLTQTVEKRQSDSSGEEPAKSAKSSQSGHTAERDTHAEITPHTETDATKLRQAAHVEPVRSSSNRESVTTIHNGVKVITVGPRPDARTTSENDSTSEKSSNQNLLINDEDSKTDKRGESGATRAGELSPMAIAAHRASSAEPADHAESADLVRAFIDGLADADASVRRYSAMTLACYGSKAAAAVSPLIHALDDRDDSVQEAAAIALAEIGPAAQPAVPHLLRKLKYNNSRVVGAALWSLEKLGKSVPLRAQEVQSAYLRATELLEPDSLDGQRIAMWLNRAADPGSIVPVESLVHTEPVPAKQNPTWAIAQWANYAITVNMIILLELLVLATLIVYLVRQWRLSRRQMALVSASSASSAEYRNVVVIQQANTPGEPSTVAMPKPHSSASVHGQTPSMSFQPGSERDEGVLRTVFEQNKIFQER